MAPVEKNVNFALNAVNALLGVVNVAPVVQAIHFKERSIQKF